MPLADADRGRAPARDLHDGPGQRLFGLDALDLEVAPFALERVEVDLEQIVAIDHPALFAADHQHGQLRGGLAVFAHAHAHAELVGQHAELGGLTVGVDEVRRDVRALGFVARDELAQLLVHGLVAAHEHVDVHRLREARKQLVGALGEREHVVAREVPALVAPVRYVVDEHHQRGDQRGARERPAVDRKAAFRRRRLRLGGCAFSGSFTAISSPRARGTRDTRTERPRSGRTPKSACRRCPWRTPACAPTG